MSIVEQWADLIPNGWELRRIKTIADVRTSNVNKKTEEGERRVKLCNYTDVYYSNSIGDASEFLIASASPKEIRRFRLLQGDVLVTKDSESRDDIAVPAYVAREFEDVLCGYHLALVRPRGEVLDGRFLFYCYTTPEIADQFSLEANGITRFGLSHDALNGALVPVPPLSTQRAIASYLDGETGKIDTLIEKKERLLDLLEEKRTALITQAVTNGLDPDVPMKDSGVEWLGEVPEHWEVVPLKRLVSKIGSGKTPRGGADTYIDDGVPLIRSQNVHFQGLHLDDVARISGATHKEMISTRVHSTDVLLNITGASLGRCCTAENLGSEPANVNQHVCILRPKGEITPQFLSNFLESHAGQAQIMANQEGISREALNFDEVGMLAIWLPPLNEQEKILTHLDYYFGNFARLSDELTDAITLFQEYRTALISAAVTGKIDVREEVPA